MSSNLEIRVPLEDFHRHFLLTHIKGNACHLLGHLERRWQVSGESFASLLAGLVAAWNQEGAYQDDDWHAREIPVDRCYFAHDDFRHYPVPKDHRFVEFMPNQRSTIDSDCFPCSHEIRAPWAGPMLEPLVQERQSEKYYVIDGQLRVIWHWYHNVPNVKVFIYKGKGGV